MTELVLNAIGQDARHVRVCAGIAVECEPEHFAVEWVTAFAGSIAHASDTAIVIALTCLAALAAFGLGFGGELRQVAGRFSRILELTWSSPPRPSAA